MSESQIQGLFITILSVAGLIVVGFVFYVFHKVFGDHGSGFASVAALILVGLAAFIGIMNLLSFSAHAIGIADPHQAFGLPEGTVRAILTIAFIVLVGVLASFLLTQTSRETFSSAPITLRQGVTPEVAQALVQQYSADGLVALVPEKEGGKFNVEFRARHDYRLADDVAKQILTILSTILAAMIGFYFGTRPTNGAAAAADPAEDERNHLLSALNALAAQASAPSAINSAADQKIAATSDQQKKAQLGTIKTKVAAAETKLEAARKTVGDASQPIDKTRKAFADGNQAIEDLKSLEKELAQITP
jgi:hypothetical protein